MRTIVIIGTGFSGTATAVHLLRKIGGIELRVLLVERGSEIGRGLAYARTPYPFLLNVPAMRMSATTNDPAEFVAFARSRDPAVSGDDFLPRALYGDYLQALLESAIAKAQACVRVERMHAEAVDIRLHGDRRSAAVWLADGQVFDADQVVLALGTPLPRLPATIRCTATWPALRKDPWSAGKVPDDDRPLLLVGTGLTMVDAATAMLDEFPRLKLHAISRHGLMPPRQTAFRPDLLGDDGGILAAAQGSVSRLMSAARHLANQAERQGGDWREVVTMLRHQIPTLWAGLPLTERARFLRHARAYWDIHRHRAPGEALASLQVARATGQLQVHAGRVQSLDAIENGVRATWIPRGSHAPRSLDVSEVIDCSGPDYDVTRSPDRLWKTLLMQGHAVPDGLKLGIRTAPSGALIGSDGAASSMLFYIGPMLRADRWEATAVGELRTHAEALGMCLAEAAFT